MEHIAEILQSQHGVISRAQALQAGLQPHDVRRLVRRRELATLLPGVYVDHTGPPAWLERAWGAVLACSGPADRTGHVVGAALAGESAMRAADGPGRPGADLGPITVAIPAERRVVALPGIVVVRTSHLDDRVRWNLGPPRMRYKEAALDVALAARGELGAIAAVSRAVQSRHTTAVQMLAALATRSRAPRRYFLENVLRDVAAGTCSVLEHGFLVLVQRPHRLPEGQRQHRVATATGIVYRDIRYGERLFELDGRLWHDTADQRDRDFERDLDAAVAGQGTVRLTWGQVYDRPCSTAAKIGRILGDAGWPGARPCGPGCAVAAVA
ncbi:hypothetical protein SFC79_02865 [Nocardioides sp. S-58]|uniref:AbiEi antitoxin N-terminal domain-containing protein n=1 Tax=Nocardioides renjunii TaxID=3095075 RepID=A0ABU5K7V9_9ACTN|nr:type IV toxin-antitoxin system AbiEi family antitoxin domain-containing protein [Nocardioides sp. S-58]MDZ5660695.1 hypothetical protein [Nocardioides sp. S-58]